MEGSVALEQEEARDEGLRYPMGDKQEDSGTEATGYPSSHRELLLWRTLAKILGLSQAALVLMMILLLRLCSQCFHCSLQEAQTQFTPTGSMKEVTSPATQGAAPGAAVFTAAPCPCLPGNGSCPMNWLRHKGKCYYFSRDPERSWSRSREDCAERDSQLLVILDQEEKDFIINRQAGDRYHWIGLHIPAPGRNWTWVDGSPFNETLVSVSGSMGQDQCVAVDKSRFYSDSCSSLYNWICQKEAGKE
ncbi:killer cell lectin-like receptor subfamily F member 1 [Rhinatrema bivittatum]|uniref:killer cell lectin-like receptor subfamily F member 1 n=1 Tax=Rhinatrema bivittatum TaxID=194408 RepID=UPI00112C0350|nr:killer cell lectin-like receptor subfamily F member 1 [Rhinatrema bivittatum]